MIQVIARIHEDLKKGKQVKVKQEEKRKLKKINRLIEIHFNPWFELKVDDELS